MKAREREQRDLEDTVDVLREDLNRTEQARKDASIKVPSSFMSASLQRSFLVVCTNLSCSWRL